MKIAKRITILIFICALGIWFYGKEEMKKIATAYIADGETLLKLIDDNCIRSNYR